MTDPDDCRTSYVTDLGDGIHYRRCRFAAALPKAYRYTAAHCWLAKAGEPDLWRVGFTRFAVRMLGDFVELRIDLAPSSPVHTGMEIGSYEGLKAVTCLYCAVDGYFHRANPALDAEAELARADPHAAGWLYEARGSPDAAAVDVHGYVAVLNATIDKLQGVDEKDSPHG